MLGSETKADEFFDAAVYGIRDGNDIVSEVCGNPDLYELMLMIMNNLGQALSQQGMVRDAINHHRAAVALLETRLKLLYTVDFSIAESEILEARDNLLHTKAHIWRASKVNGEWKEFANFETLKREVDEVSVGIVISEISELYSVNEE